MIRSSEIAATRKVPGFFLGFLAICIAGGLVSTVDAGCGFSHGKAFSMRAGSTQQGDAAIGLWLEYSGGQFSWSYLPPAKPCEGAGCRYQESMRPEPVLPAAPRIVSSLTGDSVRDRLWNEDDPSQWPCPTTFGDADDGYPIGIEHPPKV